MFFDKDGFVCIDEYIANQPSFQKIMRDEIVTEEELKGQSLKVIGLLQVLEERLNDSEKKMVMDLLTEVGVLSAISIYFQNQNMIKG